LLSAEFIVKRTTRPFGTLGFSVGAGQAQRRDPEITIDLQTRGKAVAPSRDAVGWLRRWPVRH
jgi:hypothetical protein